MNCVFQRRIIRISRLAYSRLLFFYPGDLRREFGVEMTEVFEDSLREAMKRRGPAGLAASWRSAVWELITVAGPSHLVNPTVIAGAISLLAASVLFLVFFRFVS